MHERTDKVLHGQNTVRSQLGSLGNRCWRLHVQRRHAFFENMPQPFHSKTAKVKFQNSYCVPFAVPKAPQVGPSFSPSTPGAVGRGVLFNVVSMLVDAL